HVDVPELLRILDTTDGPMAARWPRRMGPAEEVYDSPVPEFRLSRVTAGRAPVRLDAGPQILLTIGGAVTVSGAGAPVELARGGSAWVPAGSSTTLSGAGTVFRATPNLTGSATGR